MRTASRTTRRSARAGRWERTILPMAAIALVASGCMFATELDISIAADGSGSAQSLIQYDSDMARLLGPASQFRDEVLDAQAEGADVTIVPASQLRDPYTEGLRYRAAFEDAAALRQVLLDGPFDSATVRLEDGVLTIDARFDATDTGDDALPGGLMPRATARVAIDVQGRITSSNADTVTGTTHIWDFDITRDGRLQMTAELGRRLPLGLLTVLAIAIAAGGIGFVAIRRRNSGDPFPIESDPT
jgi:hypothetical protein